MRERVNPIAVGEKVSAKIYLSEAQRKYYVLQNSEYRAYGTVVKVKQVNLVLEESIESTLPGKRWLIRRNRVRRDTEI